MAIAKKFIVNDIQTVIIERNEEKLNAAKEKLGKLFYPMICDVSSLSSIPLLVEKIIKNSGRLIYW
jgi:short-subunit dehydrogenase involved in D-alanine esterification of teichoic acids